MMRQGRCPPSWSRWNARVEEVRRQEVTDFAAVSLSSLSWVRIATSHPVSRRNNLFMWLSLFAQGRNIQKTKGTNYSKVNYIKGITKCQHVPFNYITFYLIMLYNNLPKMADSRRWRSTTRNTASKMEDQQALTPGDKTRGAEDGGPAGADARRQDTRRRRWRTSRRWRLTTRHTAPKMEDSRRWE